MHNEVLFCCKKNEIMSFVRKWIKQEIVIESKISQTKKDKYCTFFLISVIWISKKNE
jgi:hypothetical protein